MGKCEQCQSDRGMVQLSISIRDPALKKKQAVVEYIEKVNKAMQADLLVCYLCVVHGPPTDFGQPKPGGLWA